MLNLKALFEPLQDEGALDAVDGGDAFPPFPFHKFSESFVSKALREGVDWRTKVYFILI